MLSAPPCLPTHFAAYIQFGISILGSKCSMLSISIKRLESTSLSLSSWTRHSDGNIANKRSRAWSPACLCPHPSSPVHHHPSIHPLESSSWNFKPSPNSTSFVKFPQVKLATPFCGDFTVPAPDGCHLDGSILHHHSELVSLQAVSFHSKAFRRR